MFTGTWYMYMYVHTVPSHNELYINSQLHNTTPLQQTSSYMYMYMHVVSTHKPGFDQLSRSYYNQEYMYSYYNHIGREEQHTHSQRNHRCTHTHIHTDTHTCTNTHTETHTHTHRDTLTLTHSQHIHTHTLTLTHTHTHTHAHAQLEHFARRIFHHFCHPLTPANPWVFVSKVKEDNYGNHL